MGRRPCCAKQGLNRGTWSALEDKILTNYIHVHGEGNWRDLPLRAGLKRCGKSCRLRWLNYLRPDIKRGNISPEEDDLIIKLHKLLGNRWALIAGRLPGRTDNEIKNYWNTNLSKRVQGGAVERGVKLKLKQIPIRAIRTKAVRCTKVVIVPYNYNGDSSNLIPPIKPNNNDEECPPYPSNHHQPLGEGGNDDLDFFLDFDVDDLLIPELYTNSRNKEMSLPSLELEAEEAGPCRMEHLWSSNSDFGDDLAFFLNGEDGSC